ncbi:MAG: proteasome accessory factor PafA2 family protein [Acidimicrobiales bacterium]
MEPPRQRRAHQRRPLLRGPRHPELSTPECPTRCRSCSTTAPNHPGQSMRQANLNLPDGEEIVSAEQLRPQGQRYGTHENYLMDRTTPFAGGQPGDAALHLPADHGCRQVGSEAIGVSSEQVPYQLTQRADFFEEVGLETRSSSPSSTPRRTARRRRSTAGCT